MVSDLCRSSGVLNGALAPRRLNQRGAAEEGMDPVLAESVHPFRVVGSSWECVLHLRHRFASEGRLVHDRRAFEEEAVARHDDVLVRICRFRFPVCALRSGALRRGALGSRSFGLALERDDVPWQQVLDRFFLPRALPKHEDVVALRPHAAESGNRLQALESRGGLKAKDGQKGEACVFPVRVEHPERGAKELEDRKRRHELFFEELEESRPGELEHVGAEHVLSQLDLGVRLQPS
mmetsp:Transcript_33399/g.92251  ORF Transcript_33399/g.92251 Transcript_33399/m.92251 type:complete len:236 (+) Transcript_33399:3225-3932(+)